MIFVLQRYEKEIIQTNNLPKIEKIQGNNLLKIEKIQGNNRKNQGKNIISELLSFSWVKSLMRIAFCWTRSGAER